MRICTGTFLFLYFQLANLSLAMDQPAPLSREEGILAIKKLIEKQVPLELLASRQAEMIEGQIPEHCKFFQGHGEEIKLNWIHEDLSLGMGGDGEVFVVESIKNSDGNDSEIQTVKVIPNIRITGKKSAREKFEHEARIVEYLGLSKGVFINESQMYYFSGYGGINIQELPKNLPIELRREIAFLFLAEVYKIHLKNVIHRDLKPRNVLVDIIEGAPKVTICDYGDAVFMGESDREKCGTLEFWPPEFFLKHRPPWSAQSEYWATGMVMFIILSGYNPESVDFLKREALIEAYNDFIQQREDDLFMQCIKRLCHPELFKRPINSELKEMIDNFEKLRAKDGFANTSSQINETDIKSKKKRSIPDIGAAIHSLSNSNNRSRSSSKSPGSVSPHKSPSSASPKDTLSKTGTPRNSGSLGSSGSPGRNNKAISIRRSSASCDSARVQKDEKPNQDL